MGEFTNNENISKPEISYDFADSTRPIIFLAKQKFFHIWVSREKYFPFNNHLSRELCSSVCPESQIELLKSKPCELLYCLPTIN